MRSFLAHCCIAGINEWVITTDMAESPLADSINASTDVGSSLVGPADAAAFFALGRLSMTDRPIAVLTGTGDASPTELVKCIRAAAERGRRLLLVTAGYRHDLSDICDSVVLDGDAVLDSRLFSPLNHLRPLHIHLTAAAMKMISEGSRTETDYGTQPSPLPVHPRPALGELARALRFRYSDGVVLMLGSLDPEEQDPALWLAEELKCPVIADAASGLREELSPNCIWDEETVLKKHSPGTVVRIGDVPPSTFWRTLENRPETDVFSITRSGYAGLERQSHVIHASVEGVAKGLGEVRPVGDPCDLMPLSRKRQGLVEELLMSHTESEQALLNALSNFACIADCIHLAGNRLVNRWDLFAQRHVPTPCVRTCPNGSRLEQLSAFLGESLDQAESWCLMDELPDEQELNALTLRPELVSGKRVIVTWEREDATRTPADRDASVAALGARSIILSSSFDLDLLDGLPQEGFHVIHVIPDPGQTKEIDEAMSTSTHR